MMGPKQCLSILVVLTFGVYSPSLLNGFAYDDMDIVRVPSVSGFPNHLVAEVQPIGDYYSSYYGKGVAGLGRGYRPTTVLSWALVHSVTKSPERSVPPGGARASAGPQHFVNILLHCFAVWLTFQMLVLLSGGGFGPVLGAAVFGLHALRSDSILSLVGRGEILGYLFGVLGLLGYVAALRRSGGGRYCYLAGSGLALFLAFTSKESAAPWVVFLPLFVLVMGWLGRGGIPSPRQQIVPWLVGVLTPFLVFLGLYLSVIGELAEFSPAYQSNPLWYLEGQRFGTGVMLMGYALYKLLVPFSLACDYGAEVFTMVETLADFRFLLAIALLVGLLALGVMRATRHPLLFLAIATFFGFTFLVSNIPFPIETIFGERHYYTPALACSFLVAWLAGKLRETRVQTVGVGILGLWCAICGGVILKRDFDWRDNTSLFAADVVSQPRSISMLLSQRDRLEFQQPAQWKQVLDKAYALSPTDPSVLQQMALFLNNTGQFAAARKIAAQGLLSRHPDTLEMRHEMHLNLGMALEGLKQPEAAEKQLLAAVAAAPKGNPITEMQFGEFYLRQQRPAEARKIYRQLMRRLPQFVDAREMLLRIAERAGDEAEVEALVRQGMRVTPNAVVLTVYLGILAERRQDPARAAELYAESVPYLPRNIKYAEYWHRFANSLAVGGQIAPARSIVGDYLSRPMPPHVKAMFMEMAKRLGM